jgi:hypothetical protein
VFENRECRLAKACRASRRRQHAKKRQAGTRLG